MKGLLLLLLTLSLPLQAQPSWPSPGAQEWSDSWYQLLWDLGIGDEQPQTPERAQALAERFVRIQAELRDTDPAPGLATLGRLHSGPELAAWARAQTPDYDAFRRLRAALAQEQKLANLPRPDFAAISGLSLGQAHPDLVKLRRLLAARLGETLPPQLEKRAVWDPPLTDALRRFQSRTQLPASGHLSPATIDALQMDNQRRLAAIRFSLRQWLQLPAKMNGDAILVNLPHYQLLALRDQSIQLVLPVIVGAPDTPTPRLNSRFASITLNPSWTPPWSIIRGELLPAYQRDPHSLKRKGFELINPRTPQAEPLSWNKVPAGELSTLLSTYQLRQRPGSNNALGKARLNLVNSRAIFLHDTPEKRLFRRSQRALSHGCIRIQDIDLLLDYLGRNIPPQHRQRLKQAQSEGITLTQSIGTTANVYIVYMPAWPHGEHGATIVPDIYNLIQVEKTAIFNRVST
ncbi:L,D-transpeptidase family protein [Ferrimonas sediminicola]|nr:L,D-transpeptidase family protein [Ferrimonas sediminicola]